MNAVGIDVSKGKSTVAVMRPFGEIVAMPFDVNHTGSELSDLAVFVSGLSGETRVIMDYTGVYFQPIARYLYDAGISVSVVHPLLIHNYGNNSIRRVKTDKKDAMKIANYGLDHWVYLTPYTPEEEIRLALKTYNRQYYRYMNLKVALKNNLISLLDHTFPELMAEIGDVRRFHSMQSLVAYAGGDAPPFQSGKFEAKKRSISKRGSPLLRKELFQLMACLMQNAPVDDPVYQFLDRKRAEVKHYYVYMIASCNKFLRIYYARVKESLTQLEQAC